jgi:CHAD domain-containing protein
VSAVEEREVKLAASPAFRFPGFDDLGDDLVAVDRAPERLLAVYLDTDDLRLTRWGVSLRHRTGEGWTLKLPSNGDGDVLVRTELHFGGDRRRPPERPLDLVLAYTRGAPVTPQARLRTLRRGVEVRDGDGRLLATLVDDEVSVLDGRRVGARFREVEVEATEDTPPGLVEEVVERLRGEGAGAPDSTPKVVRALGARALEGPEVVVGDLDGTPTAGDVVRRAIAASVARLIRHDVVVRLDTDPEGVHQARVATRRLRSDLRTFKSLVDEQWSQALRDDLKWLADALGRVRDADVMLERLQGRAEALPETSGPGVKRVLQTLRRSRGRALDDLLEVLASDRYVALLDRLVDAARDPILVGAAELPAADVLPQLVERPWRKLAKAVKALGKPPADDELHKVRIAAKRCRYAAEAVAPVVGKPAKKVASRAADLQDVLGDHNDAIVAEQWLRDWALASRSPAATFAAGELAGLERAAAESTRQQWRATWKKLDRPKLRAWM